jgi:hypothetical protein
MPYRDPAPDTKLGQMRQIAYDLLQEHVADGMIPTSIRFLYYELVVRGICSKTKVDSRSPSGLLTTALTDLRKRGVILWDDIVDETRSVENYIGAADIKTGIKDILEQVRLDPWEGEPPFAIVESRSLAGALRDICNRYCVRLAATNGQVGGFLHTDVIPLLEEGSRVLYMGDWDLAGEDIEHNTRDVLEQEVGALQWERLALTTEQVEEYDLPRITKTDRRFRDGRGEHEAVETEALSQSVITNLLKTRLDELLPEPLERVLEREARQRRAVAKLLNAR